MPSCIMVSVNAVSVPFIDEDQKQQVSNWVSEIPLTKPKRNTARDFADGVLMAELVHHYLPRLVDLHNYVPGNSAQQKISNWSTLNTKVFKKMGFQLAKSDIELVVSASPEAIWRVLSYVRDKIQDYKEGKTSVESPPHTETRPRAEEMIRMELPRDEYVDQAREKEQTILELRDTIEFLEIKINKLERLIQLRDAKIQHLEEKRNELGRY